MPHPPSTHSRNQQNRSSVDESDIARFEEIAEHWWDPTGPMRPLHQFTAVRIDYIIRSVKRSGLLGDGASGAIGSLPLSNLSVLDIGCGGGLLAEPLARLGAQITAIDASMGAISAANAHAQSEKLTIDYQHTNAEDMACLPENNLRFDVIYASEVIEHVLDRHSFIAAIASMMKPDGVLVITTINRSLPALLLAKFAAEYVLKIIPRGTHQFDRFIPPRQLQEECEEHGILLDDITGFVPNLSGGFCFSSLTAVNYGASGQLLPHSLYADHKRG